MRSLLTEIDVIRVIKGHMEFLMDEYDITILQGFTIITDEEITFEKISDSFQEVINCSIYYDGIGAFLLFGHGLRIKLVSRPGYYKNKRKQSFYNDVVTSWCEED